MHRYATTYAHMEGITAILFTVDISSGSVDIQKMT